MEQEQVKTLASALIAEIKASQHQFWIDPEIHSQQHAFITAMIDKEKRRQEFWLQVKQYVVGSLALSFVSGLLVLLGKAILDLVKHNGATQ